MRLSGLQKYILKKCLSGQKYGISKRVIASYYQGKNIKPENIISDITKSVDRLIEKDLIHGYGKKTKKKWFIHEVHLTPKGKKEGIRLLGEQQKLPLQKYKKNI